MGSAQRRLHFPVVIIVVEGLVALSKPRVRSARAFSGADARARNWHAQTGQDQCRRQQDPARERDAQAQTEYQSKLARRQTKRDAGKELSGKDPEPPTSAPQDKDQITSPMSSRAS